jgi:hypothetical protein
VFWLVYYFLDVFTDAKNNNKQTTTKKQQQKNKNNKNSQIEFALYLLRFPLK